MRSALTRRKLIMRMCAFIREREESTSESKRGSIEKGLHVSAQREIEKYITLAAASYKHMQIHSSIPAGDNGPRHFATQWRRSSFNPDLSLLPRLMLLLYIPLCDCNPTTSRVYIYSFLYSFRASNLPKLVRSPERESIYLYAKTERDALCASSSIDIYI